MIKKEKATSLHTRTSSGQASLLYTQVSQTRLSRRRSCLHTFTMASPRAFALPCTAAQSLSTLLTQAPIRGTAHPPTVVPGSPPQEAAQVDAHSEFFISSTQAFGVCSMGSRPKGQARQPSSWLQPGTTLAINFDCLEFEERACHDTSHSTNHSPCGTDCAFYKPSISFCCNVSPKKLK